jgi:hypothetical protein
VNELSWVIVRKLIPDSKNPQNTVPLMGGDVLKNLTKHSLDDVDAKDVA